MQNTGLNSYYIPIPPQNFQPPVKPNEAFQGETQLLQTLYTNYACSNRYTCINGQWVLVKNPNFSEETYTAIGNRLNQMNALPAIPKSN